MFVAAGCCVQDGELDEIGRGTMSSRDDAEDVVVVVNL